MIALYLQTLLCLLAPAAAFFNHRFLRSTRGAPPLQGDAPLISVCIPARDEEANVANCLGGLVAQSHPNFEVLVLDDESRDRTAEIVESFARRDSRVRLIRGEPLPEGWIGKPHACRQLGEAARGDFLLFTDADTVFHPECLSRVAAAAVARKADLLTGIPRVIAVGFWERIIVPLLPFAFLALTPIRTLEWPRLKRHAAGSGAFLFFRAEAYRAIGGHGSVADRIVEDLALCRAVKVAGLRLAIFDVSPFLAVRMYRSLGAIWEGFTKNSFAVFGANWFAMLAGLAVLWSMLLLPWVWFVFGPSWGWSATASTALPLIQIASIVVARVMSDRLGGRPDLLATLLIPLSCLTATAICLHAGLRSLFGRPTRWRGRAYSAVDG